MDNYSHILPPLVSMMKVDLIVKPDGDLWLFHDEPLGVDIEWVEYDVKDKTITFISDQGKSMELGMTITSHMEPHLLNSKIIQVALVENEQILGLRKISIVLREV